MGEKYWTDFQKDGGLQHRLSSHPWINPRIPARNYKLAAVDYVLAGLYWFLLQCTSLFPQRFAKTFSSLPIRIFFQAYKYIQNRL